MVRTGPQQVHGKSLVIGQGSGSPLPWNSEILWLAPITVVFWWTKCSIAYPLQIVRRHTNPLLPSPPKSAPMKGNPPETKPKKTKVQETAIFIICFYFSTKHTYKDVLFIFLNFINNTLKNSPFNILKSDPINKNVLHAISLTTQIQFVKQIVFKL